MPLIIDNCGGGCASASVPVQPTFTPNCCYEGNAFSISAIGIISCAADATRVDALLADPSDAAAYTALLGATDANGNPELKIIDCGRGAIPEQTLNETEPKSACRSAVLKSIDYTATFDNCEFTNEHMAYLEAVMCTPGHKVFFYSCTADGSNNVYFANLDRANQTAAGWGGISVRGVHTTDGDENVDANIQYQFSWRSKCLPVLAAGPTGIFN